MNFFDNMIAAVSPAAALRRTQARAELAKVKRSLGASGSGGASSAQSSGYSNHGASRHKKALVGWVTQSGSPKEDIDDNIGLLRERSRDLFMGGSPMATGAIKTIRTNVVGSGLRLKSQLDSEFLGLSASDADDLERAIEREFSLWADNQDCDAARSKTFGQIQSLAVLSALISGDVFATLPVVPRVGRVYDLRILLIESDRIATPAMVDIADRDRVVEGIEHDKYGAPVAYYIADRHPKSFELMRENEVKRVPAFGKKTGRRNVLHITQDLERPGQMRGVPLLAPVIEAIKQLGRYTDAELMAAVVSSFYTVFIKTATPDLQLGEAIPMEEQVDTGDLNSYEMGNGSIVALNEGESIETANPGRPNTAFDGFVIAVCRQIGAAIELPYELLLKQFTASYSASRAALLEAWKMFMMRRSWLVENFCQPVYEEWLSEAVAKGRISAPGFFEDPAVRAAWCRADWYGPSQGQLDPLKEARAGKVRVDEGFSTRERESAELGGQSYDQIHRVRSREESRRRDDGLTPPLIDAEVTNAE